jgi:PHD/YefM family antitoxin component YafN of YafNO toxin-antitoxin module
MKMATILAKEKIISLSEIQKNPAKALTGDIVRIVKNGKEIGIFMSKEQFEDFIEEFLPLNEDFEKELKESIKQARNGNTKPLKFD